MRRCGKGLCEEGRKYRQIFVSRDKENKIEAEIAGRKAEEEAKRVREVKKVRSPQE